MHVHRVTRFVIENSIEERILKLQEKKSLVFEGYVHQACFCWLAVIYDKFWLCAKTLYLCYSTVGGSTDALGKLTAEDLQFLFTR